MLGWGWGGGEGLARVMTQLKEGSQLQAWECVGSKRDLEPKPDPPSSSWGVWE